MTHNAHPVSADLNEADPDIVAAWLRLDPVRWMSGVMAGFLAGLIAMIVAMIVARIAGMEFWFPIKLGATAVLGPAATEFGMNLTPILTGFLLWEGLAVFWGVIYSHFVATNSPGPLLAMGLVWGLFLWIFNWNLYFHSIRSILFADVPSTVAFLICVTYGLSLSSVAFFDRTLRK